MLRTLSTCRAMADAYALCSTRFAKHRVSGSKGPAATGTLIFMAAGDRSVFDAATAELSAMGKRSVFVSEEVGAATRMKLVVNLIMGTQCARHSRTPFSSCRGPCTRAGLDTPVCRAWQACGAR